MPESKTRIIPDDHLIITPPDRYYGDGVKILWIDWEWSQIESCIASLRGSPEKLIIYIFGPGDTEFTWLLDRAAQCDLVIANLSNTTQADFIKGNLISNDKTFYYGRRDLSDIFPGYIDDPQGAMLSWIGQYVEKRIE